MYSVWGSYAALPTYLGTPVFGTNGCIINKCNQKGFISLPTLPLCEGVFLSLCIAWACNVVVVLCFVAVPLLSLCTYFSPSLKICECANDNKISKAK